MKKSYIVNSGLLSLLVLASCGRTKDAAQNVAQRIEEPAMMRTFESAECLKSPVVNLSYKIYYNFSGNNFKEVHTFFRDENCITPSVDVTYSGKFDLRDRQAGKDVRPVDFRYETVDVRAADTKGKETLDKLNFCGEKDWQVARATQIASEKTGTPPACPLKKVPSTEFNLVLLDSGNLYLGQTGIQSLVRKAEDRPRDVKRDYPLVRSGRNL